MADRLRCRHRRDVTVRHLAPESLTTVPSFEAHLPALPAQRARLAELAEHIGMRVPLPINRGAAATPLRACGQR